MSAEIKVDLKEFNDTLKKCWAIGLRKMPEEINARAFFIAKAAREHTPLANRALIASELGAIAKSERVDKKGRTRRSYNYKPTILAYKLVNWRRTKAGKPGAKRDEMASEAKKLIQARLKAVGSLKAGWNNVTRMFARAAKQFINVDGPRVKMGSKGLLAKEGWSPKAELEYNLTIKENGTRQVDPRVVRALEFGFSNELRNMKERIERKLREAAKEAGIRTN